MYSTMLKQKILNSQRKNYEGWYSLKDQEVMGKTKRIDDSDY